jgi:two-component system, OmpR family, response regulator
MSEVSQKSKVVIGVDDDGDYLALLSRVVIDAGYTFFGVPSGKECLALLERVRPRLVLLDIHMAEMDGFEVCRRIRATAGLKYVPVAFLTARKTTEDVRAGMAAGGNDFIIKPFSPEHLRNRLSHWVNHRHNKGW